MSCSCRPTDKGDTSYVITYDNVEYKTIHDYNTIQFVASGGDIESLYQGLKSVFDTGKDINITLGNSLVLVASKKLMGITSIYITTKDGYFFLTSKQLDKLFGKR